MMLTTLPVLPPYSAENAFVSTSISCTAASGMFVKIVCLPQLSLPVLPSTSNQVCRRPAPLVVNKIFVHEHVALVDGWPVGRVQQRQIRDAAIRQRRLLHLGCIQPVT